MFLNYLDWFIIIAYFLISLVIGLYFAKRASQSTTEFFLGGRNLPWWLAGTSMVATTFAADTPLAVAELIATKGIAGNWLWWNMLAGGMITTFFFAKLWQRANILTDVEFIELRYSGLAASFLRCFRSIYMGLLINTVIIGWVNVAMISILMVFFQISYSEAFLFVGLAMLLVMVYASVSGYLGVVWTDAVQFWIAMAGTITLAVIVVNSDKIGGMAALQKKLPESALNFFPTIQSATDLSSIGTSLSLSLGSFLTYIAVQWWASWYPGSEPGGGGYIAQRMMSAKDEKNAIYATLFFQIAHYCIRPWPWILVGLAAIVLYPELPVEDKKLGYVYAMRDFLPNGLRGLLLVAFFAAYMSTIATQLNWGTSYLINDFYKRFVRPDSSEKELVLASRIATFLTMLLAVFVTSLITTISGAWQFLMECGAGLGLVLILRWYWWRVNAWSEITATIAPFLFYALSKYYLALEFPGSFFLTVGCTTFLWIFVTYLTPSEPLHLLQNFYRRIQPGGFWKPIAQSLEMKQNKGEMGYLLLTTLVSILMAYSMLFLIGKLILGKLNESLLYLCILFLSFLVLRLTLGKLKL